MTSQATINYENPPIDEIVCGIRFDSIKQLQSGHVGILWQKFRPDFPKIEDQILVNPVPKEDFENPKKLPLPRVWFIHEKENDLVQLQRNRFLHNWRKRQPEDEYPGYVRVIENFEKYLSYLQEFLAEENLGGLVAQQYELTYINLIPKGNGWEHLRDLGKVFPNLVSLTSQSIFSTDIKDINWQTVLGLPNNLGKLRVALRNGTRVSDNQLFLLTEFNVHSYQPYQPMRAWFDAAHDTIIKVFSTLVSDEVQEKYWGRQSC